jgi:hypothetical protein
VNASPHLTDERRLVAETLGVSDGDGSADKHTAGRLAAGLESFAPIDSAEMMGLTESGTNRLVSLKYFLASSLQQW